MTKRLYFANNTEKYHGGSWAVCEVIRKKAHAAGWTVVPEKSTKIVEKEVIATCDAVLVNGEGTLHRNKPRARHLLSLFEFAQQMKIGTVLCNTSWFDMNGDFDHVLRKLDYFSVREPLSAGVLGNVHGLQPELHIDLSFWHSQEIVGMERKDVLVTDFYSREFDCFAVPNGGPLAGIPMLDMRTTNWRDTISAIASAEILVTGRFHGLLAALKTKTPFVAYPGNTPKLEAMLHWFGDSRTLVKDFRNLLLATSQARKEHKYYEDIFSWAHSLSPWRFPI